MGQPANYIIKNNGQLTIHYNHWRANCITSDLYLGEKKFLEFVNDCQLGEELIPEPGIEGCVIIEPNAKQLYFWALCNPVMTSVTDYYLARLAERWPGWNVRMVENRMYDAEKILNIDYISRQTIYPLNNPSKEQILDSEVRDWSRTVVVIKRGQELFATKGGILNTEMLVSYGKEIIPLVNTKPPCQLPDESDPAARHCVVIDTVNKKLFISTSEFGIWEQSKQRWEGYQFIMGDYGYIKTLRLAGIDTTGICMAENEIVPEFESLVKPIENFDPLEMAGKLLNDYPDGEFNPNFFDNVQPEKTLLQKFKKLFKR